MEIQEKHLLYTKTQRPKDLRKTRNKQQQQKEVDGLKYM